MFAKTHRIENVDVIIPYALHDGDFRFSGWWLVDVGSGKWDAKPI